MKTNKLILTAAIVSCIGSTAMAADSTTNDYHTGQYPVAESVKNSIIYGHDTNVTQAQGHLSGIIAGGENNTVQLDAHNSATFGISNNNNSENSVVAGSHNTITNANNSIAGGIYNASHSSNTAIFGYNNAIDFNSDNSFAGGKKVKVQGQNSFAFGEEAHAFGNNAIAIGKNVEALGDDSINIGANNTVQDSLSNGVIIGTNNTVNKYYSGELNGKNIVAIGNGNLFENSSESIAIGGSIIQGADRSVGIGANSKVAAPNSVALGYDTFAYDVESTESAEINGKTYTFAGGKAYGTVGIGARGENGKRTITGLAAGRINEDSTDAVNGSQLHSVVDAINNNANAIANINNNAVVQGGENIHIDTVNGNQRGVSLARNLQHMESAQFGNDDDTDGTRITKKGINVANNNSNTNVSAGAVRTFSGPENTGMTAKGIVIENTDTLEQASFTSGGIQASDDNATIRFTTTDVNAGNQQVHGVKAGTVDSDAVNVSQLHTVTSEVKNNANAIKMNSDTIKELTNVNNNNFATINNNLNSLDTKINTLDSKVNANQKEARKGIASVSALAALHPLDYNPDHKVDIMAGVGHYRGNTAVALGVAYRPNENTMFTVGASINGKDTAINAGVSYKVGAKDIQYRSPASMAKDIDDLKAIVNQLVQENEALKNQNK